MRLCEKKIELEKTGIVVTYCILPLGHKEKCQPDPQIASRYKDLTLDK